MPETYSQYDSDSWNYSPFYSGSYASVFPYSFVVSGDARNLVEVVPKGMDGDYDTGRNLYDGPVFVVSGADLSWEVNRARYANCLRFGIFWHNPFHDVDPKIHQKAARV